MRAPNLLQDDFLRALQAYMPKGRAWPTDPSATLTKALKGMANAFAIETRAANDLLIDAFPASTADLLPEWQATLAQPDQNGPQPANTAQADQFVVAKFAGTGGQSIAAIQAFAAAYGITISSVNNLAPFRAGQSRCGQQCGTTDWFFVWQIHFPHGTANTYSAFFQKISPAHSIVQFVIDP